MLTRPWEILAASALGSTKIIMPLWVWGGVLALVVICIAKNGDMIEKKVSFYH